MPPRRLFLIALALYLLTLAVRLPGICTASFQTDEPLWVNRAARVLSRLQSAPSSATTHLGQPGVPPSLVMAAGQGVGGYIQKQLGLDASKAGYLDEVSLSRIAVCSVSSLLVPVMFLSLSSILGWLVAIVASVLCLLDPLHIQLSRYAHLDAMLALWVWLCVLCYYYSYIRQHFGLRMLAGVFWGLCIATKPTAAVLLPLFVFWKAVLSILSRRMAQESAVPPSRTREFWISGADIGAFFVAHLTFASIYTRLWHHLSDYNVRLKLRAELAKELWRTGKWLQQEYWLPVLLCVLLAGLAAYSFLRTPWRRYGYGVVLLLVALLSLTLAPQLWQNCVLYWTWVLSLSTLAHQSYGVKLPPPPGGYSALFLYLTTPILLCGSLLGILGLLGQLLKRTLAKTQALLLLCTLLFLCFTVPLSLSSKQSIRYAIPAVAFGYVLGAFICVMLSRTLATRLELKISPLARYPGLACALLLSVVVSAQTTSAISAAPFDGHYYNFLLRNPTPFLDVGVLRTRAGQPELHQYLREVMPGTRTLVTVRGDSNAHIASFRRRFPADRDRVLLAWFPPHAADFLIVDRFLQRFVGSDWQQTMNQQPLIETKILDQWTTRLYAVPYFRGAQGLTFDFGGQQRKTGRVLERDGERLLVVEPSVDAEGIVFNDGLGMRLAAGKYRIELGIKALAVTLAPPQQTLLTLSLGENCTHTLTAEQVLQPTNIEEGTKLQSLVFECQYPQDARHFYRVYWHGAAPLALKSLRVVPLE